MRNKRGVIFLMAIAMTAILLFAGLSGANMILRDAYLIKRLVYSMQALYVAEAGMSDALSRLCDSYSLDIFPLTGTVDSASYTVTSSSVAGRVLLTSTGTVPAGTVTVSRAVKVEIEDNSPTAMNFIMSAGNNVRIKGGFLTASFMNGNVHANNNVYLKTGIALGYVNVTGTATHSDGDTHNTYIDTYFGWIDVDGYPRYGTGTHVTEPAWNGTNVTFPVFDYPYFAALTQGTADTCYYPAGHTFDGVTLSPSCGLIYVNGPAVFRNNCTINGGIIADSIKVETYVTWIFIIPIIHVGKLNQNVAGDKNQIVSRLGNIDIQGELHAHGALVYASGDFRSIDAAAIVDVTGVIAAGSNINFEDYLAAITYNYQRPSVKFGPNSLMVKIDSWNR
ncbi:MAG: hypothetical protein PHS37_04895 [Candidatus Omnitrophica bacterium]|nr:hypothetical protein [Candidatus Omnitrophota bacterium]